MLEYKIDGKTEDLKYITSTQKERGTIFQPVLGLPNKITICKNFTGALDDFRILNELKSMNSDFESKNKNLAQTNSLNKNSSTKNNFSDDFYSIENSSLENLNFNFYKLSGGEFVSEPIMTVPGAQVENIQTIQNLPSQTEVRYYIRAGENIFGWTDENPTWKEILPNKKIENINGRYFQIKAELFPDGAGEKTPEISEIKINYFEPSLPLAPVRVKAVALDGAAELKWNFSLDDSVEGYYLYYGTRPGEYLGSGSAQGASPIDVKNVNTFTVTGLQNGVIYYFALASYSKYDKRIVGNFSEEVFARPKKSSEKINN